VLVSQATQTLLEDEEDDLAVGLRDLGERQLKDLDRPVRLFEVTAPGLSEASPPARRRADLARPVRPRAPSMRLVILVVTAGLLVAIPVVALLTHGH
jgi:hypothetical protein